MNSEKKYLWKEAIKWPLYILAIMPVIISASYYLSIGRVFNIRNFFIFLIASILLLLWENLTNDLFDSFTGIDEFKFHSLVNLLGNKKLISKLSVLSFIIGILLISFLSINTSFKVLLLVSGSCFLGYIYQGPPFRLGYLGLGEPLCWIAFGPFAYGASLLAIAPLNISLDFIPWNTSLIIGSGPALATSLVLFCSHFHQIDEDRKYGKKSPLVYLGTKRSSLIIPAIILIIYILEIYPTIIKQLPISSLICILSLPWALTLINSTILNHNNKSVMKSCKYKALRFQSINGILFALGLSINYFNKIY
tara:strand:+ start:5232 stop:6152 length:921 start_codon:yes stop_codon:yes gene_type:complete